MALQTYEKRSIQTKRLNVSYLVSGKPGNEPLILIHGNVSSNLFLEDTVKLVENYHVFAPDLRGYGETEALPIDATHGLRDWADDLKSFVDALNIDQPMHLLGWSMGGGIAIQYAIDHPKDVMSITLVNPISPYGFGGTKDISGTPCYPNNAGSGGGTVNQQFVESIRTQNRSTEDANSPRQVLNQFYFKPPFRVTEDKEEAFVDSMLSTRVGEGFYPGSFETCNEWPGVIPGTDGVNNALSPKYMNLSSFVQIAPKPPVLWLRGSDDLIVSDTSFFDFAYLGKLGHVPGWPGDDDFPPQPMVSQMRHFLEAR
ncbi:alpha/beta fold hydrolase [Numidum massiliense]|uniref:alpha/beta fold hydrolase n=1 Tax=Numidum massiliense TaxID=1522315 RepID=UPI0006D558BF|nr:alpha/beta fold hydrolase [Numidum massiliense]